MTASVPPRRKRPKTDTKRGQAIRACALHLKDLEAGARPSAGGRSGPPDQRAALRRARPGGFLLRLAGPALRGARRNDQNLVHEARRPQAAKPR